MSQKGILVDRTAQASRFSRFASEPRAVLPAGHSAPLDMRPIRQRIREEAEKQNGQ